MTTSYVEIPGSLGSLRGLLHHGKGAGAVVMVHGYFSANKIGPNRLYVQIAWLLAELGYDVLRVDLSGVGESDGSIEDARFSHHVSDVRACCEYLAKGRTPEWVDVVSHCAGAHTAISAALAGQHTVRSITMIAPFLPTEENFKKLLLTRQVENDLRSQGWAYRKHLYCHRSFIDGAYVLEDAKRFRENWTPRLRVIVPREDEFTPATEVSAWADRAGAISAVLDGSDHNVLPRDARDLLFRTMLKWFAA